VLVRACEIPPAAEIFASIVPAGGDATSSVYFFRRPVASNLGLSITDSCAMPFCPLISDYLFFLVLFGSLMVNCTILVCVQ
jgi:hypothetical protein